MSDAVEQRFDELGKLADQFAEAQAQAEHLSEFRRSKKALLMKEAEVSGTKTAAIQERETVLSTAFENGVAIPHPRNPLPDALGQSVIAFGRLPSGIAFGAPHHVMTDMFFLVVCRDS